MPAAEYEWIERKEILSFEEITRLVRIFTSLGVDKIRLTGGEPLLRRRLDALIGMLSDVAGLQEICLTTNGALLAERAEALRAAGLSRINVSIDSLNPEKFRQITQRGNLDKVLEGLFAAKRCGINPIKINAVIERGVNDAEILDLIEFGKKHAFGIRFIEYMDVGNANHWKSDRMVPKEEILAKIRERYELIEAGRDRGSAPSVDYRFAGSAGDVGVIASISEPFCSSCTRARLTADGKLVTCLFSDRGHDLKALLRASTSDEEIIQHITAIWQNRTDRYSHDRLVALNSDTGYRPEEHKKIEMIVLGG